jgi:hypothetical protein
MPGFEKLWFNQRDRHELEARDIESAALRRAGWTCTSSTPTSTWMWQKEIDGKVYMVSQKSAAAIQERFERSAYFDQYPDELGD